ncbi:NAD(P)-binding protein [Chloroflexota bacterium]
MSRLRLTFEDKIPTCQNACPLGNNIPRFVGLIGQGKYLDAWKVLKETNPMPGVCGRVCHSPCERYCNRTEFDESVSIRALERLVADCVFDIKTTEESTSQERIERVAIVGSGPAGLACSYFLVKRGYKVTVFEASSEIGGTLRTGVPAYRLPRRILNKEISDIEALGVCFRTNVRIGDISVLRDYDAIFVATGTHINRNLNIPGEDIAGVIPGIEFLRKLNLGVRVEIGKRVVVIGGGNTAVDAARCARRLGADVTIVYRRTVGEMPAIQEEINATYDEGIEIVEQVAPTKIMHRAGRSITIKFTKMQTGEVESTGRKRLFPVDNSEFRMRADAIIIAIGEQPDFSWLPEGYVPSESGSNIDGIRIFAGGDFVTTAGTVADAIASGRRAAHLIDQYFMGGKASIQPPKKLAPYEYLNTAYSRHQVSVKSPQLTMTGRLSSFSEINLELSTEEGITEAKRCFSCGICMHCDNCLNFCPEMAISRRNDCYDINYDYCKGCKICKEECPPGCISLVEVQN